MYSYVLVSCEPPYKFNSKEFGFGFFGSYEKALEAQQDWEYLRGFPVWIVTAR